MKFNNKIVLITGGSRGIGKATAIAFAERGATVVLVYKNNEAAAEETLQQLSGKGHIAIKTDVKNPEKVRQMINQVVKKFDRLDIVVNNAGIHYHHPIDKVSYQDWQDNWQLTLQTNLIGPANICYCAAQYMILQGSGRIVNVSSRGAFRGEPEQPAYGASKAGLNAMSQSLAQSLAPHNIFVGVVAPGFVETDLAKDILEGPDGEAIRQQSPLKRVARPEEVARAILFLASEGSEFMTGAILDVNGASYLRS
jgi:3-oxoacyl-[acyl-carrier protein] reductase